MTDMTDLMNMRRGEAKRPVTAPPGHYSLLITDYTYPVYSSQKKTKGIEIEFELEAPDKDVNLENFEGGWGELAGKKLKNTFYLTEASLFMYEDFLAALFGDSWNGTFGEAMPRLKGSRVKGKVVHEMIGEGDQARPIAKLKNFIPA